jgi:hypothetical protein
MKPLCRFLWVAIFLPSLVLSAFAQGNSNTSTAGGSQQPALTGAPGSQPAGNTGAEPGKATPPSNAEPTFQVITEKIDITLKTWQPPNTLIHLKNIGKTRLEKLTIAGVLADAEKQGHLNILISDVALGIEPGQEKVVELGLNLPGKLLAGTYTGSLRLSADGSPAQSVATTLRTRGPVVSGLYSIPFIIFLLVLTVGCWVSFALDKYFGLGGLKRDQARLTLWEIEKGSNEILDGIKDLETVEPAGINLLKPLRIRIETNLKEGKEKLAGLGNLSLVDLEKEINRLLLAFRQNSILWSRIEIVRDNFPPPGNPVLLDKLKKLVNAPLESDLDKYREALMRIIESTEGMPANAVPPTADSIIEVGNTERQREINEENIRAKIKRMDLLLNITIWVAIFFGSYMTFYATNFDFGTLVDYISLFLWTLGLTQTGKKVLERATSSYTPKA